MSYQIYSKLSLTRYLVPFSSQQDAEFQMKVLNSYIQTFVFFPFFKRSVHLFSTGKCFIAFKREVIQRRRSSVRRGDNKSCFSMPFRLSSLLNPRLLFSDPQKTIFQCEPGVLGSA